MRASGLILFIWGLHSVGKAADSYRLNTSASQKISEKGICRNVTNGSSSDHFIATKTTAEYRSFVDAPPVGISMSNCCPAGFVLVPASASKGTSEFCVMKWEARTTSNTGVATSTGAPSNWLTKAQAISRCQAMGAGYDLITNDQWTAMMRDIEGVNANWSGGARKSGCLKIGNIGVTNNCAYDGSLTEAGEANVKAKHVFSNGQEIWHLGGNLSEWVQGTISTASAERIVSNPWNARGGTSYSKLSAADRANFGPLYDDYDAGCGAGDQSNGPSCGVGLYFFGNTHAYVIRGSEAGDDRWDAFHLESYSSDMSDSWIGYRCTYTP